MPFLTPLPPLTSICTNFYSPWNLLLVFCPFSVEYSNCFSKCGLIQKFAYEILFFFFCPVNFFLKNQSSFPCFSLLWIFHCVLSPSPVLWPPLNSVSLKISVLHPSLLPSPSPCSSSSSAESVFIYFSSCDHIFWGHDSNYFVMQIFKQLLV